MIESYWLVHIVGSSPIPVDYIMKERIESALTDKTIDVVYFSDIFDKQHDHIVPRSAITHLEYSDTELRERRARHNAEIYHQAGEAYFERRLNQMQSHKMTGNALGMGSHERW